MTHTFQRGEPTPSDPNLGHVYGLALPLLKRGLPVAPVQLENVGVTNYLNGFDLLLLTYHGQKPLTPEVHVPLAAWVRAGGALVVWDNDTDPYLSVREWWNGAGRSYRTPRQHLFETLGLPLDLPQAATRSVRAPSFWHAGNPAALAGAPDGDTQLLARLKEATTGSRIRWQETNSLLLRRGPYIVAAGLDESIEAAPRMLRGRYVNLFDPNLALLREISLAPGGRFFLLDLDAIHPRNPTVLASACRTLAIESTPDTYRAWVEGVGNTPAIVLLSGSRPPTSVTLAGTPVETARHDAESGLLWLRFINTSGPRELRVTY